MVKYFAYVLGVQHTFLPWKRKKGSWRATCTCNSMLEKTGPYERVLESWKEHVQEESERKDATAYFTEIK